MTIQRLENVGIVVEDLDAATTWFTDLGLAVRGRDTVEGDWVDRCVGLTGVRCRIAMLETLDGHGHLELMSFDHPEVVDVGDREAPPNTLGIRRLAFVVDDIDAALAGLPQGGAEVLDEVVDYEGVFRMCYLRGPEGIIVMLAQQTGSDDRADQVTRGG